MPRIRPWHHILLLGLAVLLGGCGLTVVTVLQAQRPLGLPVPPSSAESLTVIGPWHILLLLTFAVFLGGWLYHRWLFPHGYSHSCDIGVQFALRRYAEDHDGAFPAGESTPEASLSLLYPEYADAETLCGKIVPRDVVKAILDRGDKLGPDTCGWYYVEGLGLDDDGGLAIAWDKIGLGHNGQRRPDGGHSVIFLREPPRWVPGDQWPAFILEQERLLPERLKKGRHAN